MHKKALSWLLSFSMLLSLFVITPITAYAAEITQRYICDAEVLPSGDIGVLFIYGGTSSSGIVSGGTLFYGVYDPDNQNWIQEAVTPGGGAPVAAKDASMALDSDKNPCVAYVFTGSDSYDDIGFTYLSEGSWTETLSFSSNNDGNRTDGTLSSPKIAVDSSGIVHIAYIDSQGNNLYSSYSRHPDMMYRTINGGFISESETIVHGFCENAGGSTYSQNIVVSVPAITCVGNTAYIGCGSKGRYGGPSDWNGAYTIYPRPSGSNTSFGLYYGSSSTCERGFKQYAMADDGISTHTLYYVSGTTIGNIPAGLHIANGTSSPTFLSSLDTGITTGDITTSDGKVYGAGINTSTLVLFQHIASTTKTLTTPLSSTHTRMATVVTDGNQYILYTGNDSDSSLFIASVPIDGGDLNEFQVPNKTPVFINGVTVADKEYDGIPVVPEGTLTVTGAPLVESDLAYTYTGTGTTNYPPCAVAPTDEGTYQLVISVPEENETYTGISSPISFTIAKKDVILTGITANNRIYSPGDVNVNLNVESAVISGKIEEDDSFVTLDTSTAAGTVSTADAGNGKSVTVSGFTLTGSKSYNYALIEPTDITVNISPAELVAPTVVLSADFINGGLTVTASDAANPLGVDSYTVEIYKESVLKKTIIGINKDSAQNISLESEIIEAESSYTAKAKSIADATGNYTDSVLGVPSSLAIAQYAPLGFNDSPAYDIPASQVDKAISPMNLSGGVTGGKAPYVYSAAGLPGWMSIDSNTGIITGTPTAVVAEADSASITVTDNQSNQQSITISYGVVEKGDALAFGGTAPAETKTYGNTPFDIAGLTYANGNGDVNYSYVSGPGSLSGTLLTITGVGNIVVRATGTSENYNTKTEDFTITVNKKVVTITPTAINNTKVYGESDPVLAYSQSGLVGGDSLSGTVLSRAVGENAGSYLIAIAGDAATNNPNYDITLASENQYFTITKKAITIVGATINPKAYDGSTSINIADVTAVIFNGLVNSETLIQNTDFEVTAASYTNDVYVDTDKATAINVVLKNTSKANNYEFINGSDVYTSAMADITAATQTITAVNQTLTVTHTLDLSTIASSNATGAELVYSMEGGSSAFATLSGSILTGIAEGEVKININSAAVNANDSGGNEYNAANQKQITVTVSAKGNADSHITFSDGNITYGQTYTPSPTTDLNGGAWNYQYVGTTNDGTAYNSTEAPIKAGSYTVTATYENDTHIGTKTVALTIIPKSITITGVTATPREYDGTTNVMITGGTLNGIVGSDAVTPMVPALGTIDDGNVGNHKTVTLNTITLNGADKDNYILTQPMGITATITPKVITFTVEGIPDQQYTGSQITPTPTVKDSSTTLTKDVHYTLSYGSNLNGGTDAGSITITGIGNYLGSSASVTFNITKATYSGSAIQATKQVLSNTVSENVAYDLSTLNFPAGFSNMNFKSVSIENDSEGLLSGASLSGNILTFDATSKDAGTTGELHVVVGSTNYNDYILVLTVTTVDKTPVTVTGVTVANKTYNAAPFVPVGTPTNDGGYSGVYEYWYEGTGLTVYGSNVAPSNAGDYRLTIRIPATNPTYVGEQMVSFSISKAALTVKPQNMSIYKGVPLPLPTIAYEGLKGSDDGSSVAQLSSGNLDIEIKDSDGVTVLTNSGIKGSYSIVFIGSPVFSETNNYTIAIAEGTLAITERSSGGGGGSSPLPPAPKQEAPVSGGVGSATVEVKTDTKTSSASAELTVAQVSGDKNIVVTMPKIDAVTNNILGMPVTSLSDTSTNGTITMSTVAGNIILPSHMLAGTNATAGSKAEVSLGMVKASDLPATAQDKVGDRPIVSLRLSIDGKNTAWNNPNAPVTVSIPYTPTAAELQNTDRITAFYIDGSGNLQEMKDAKYDPVTKSVIFTTTHFSYYAVGYKTSIVNGQFNDVLPGAWYYDAVTFIAEKGIATGTGSGKFSPKVLLTRGQFIVMLMRAYSITPDASPADNFADAGNTYYTNYLATAKRLGISAGMGNNLFAPEKEITRQEMFTLLYNALTVIGELPEGNSGNKLSDFSDAASVASWAKNAMTLLIETGTISGNNGKLSPNDRTTRGEMAQVLYNLLAK